MTDDANVVDGFSDAGESAGNLPDAPDPGTEGTAPPLSPEEYAKAKREIEKQGDTNRSGHREG